MRAETRADSQSQFNCQLIMSNRIATEFLKVRQKVRQNNLHQFWDKWLSLKSLFSAQLHIQKSNTFFSLRYETKKANQQTPGRVSKVGMLSSHFQIKFLSQCVNPSANVSSFYTESNTYVVQLCLIQNIKSLHCQK